LARVRLRWHASSLDHDLYRRCAWGELDLNQVRLRVAIVTIGVVERVAEEPLLRLHIPLRPRVAGDCLAAAHPADEGDALACGNHAASLPSKSRGGKAGARNKQFSTACQAIPDLAERRGGAATSNMTPGPITLLAGDAGEMLSTVEDESVSLIVTSPPYNIGKEYERSVRRTFDEYRDWIAPIARLCADKIRSGGHLCWQSGNYVENGAIVPLDYLFFSIFRELGLTLRNRIIWHFNFGLHATRRLSGRYETLLWFTKGDEYVFNLDPIRVPQRYPGKRHPQSRVDKAGKPSGNPKGKNPGDVWTFDPEVEFKTGRLWQFPNVKANHVEKTLHPCQFPIELAERCVLALTQRGELVLDPFVGTGTSLLAAAKHERRGIGIDLSEEYLGIARQRYEDLLTGQLQERTMGRPVMLPDTTQKVAQSPAEWGCIGNGEEFEGGGESASQSEAKAKIDTSREGRTESPFRPH
jgi:adenine-specific DNA-methyltransferase